jgi:hypothetical protein
MSDQIGTSALTPEARKVLSVAEQFADMARLSNLDGRQSEGPPRRIFAEGAVLAFAVELMLKTLHQQAFNKKEHGHEIWKLYRKLPIPIKDALKTEFVDGASNFDRAIDAHYISMGVTPPGMEDLLKGGNDAFALLRYAYEGKLPEQMGLGRVMGAIRRYLFKCYPDANWLSGLNG